MLTLVSALAFAGAGSAAEPAKTPTETVVLDLNRGSFRVFEGWRTPTLISADGKLKPLLEPRRKDLKEEDRKPVPVRGSAPPPADWAAVDFDDSCWPRISDPAALNRWPSASAYGPANPLEGSLVCLRGKFRVADPAAVKDLKVSLTYFGGAVVYVNGAELARGHLPAGKLEPETLAERYADEAYITADGKIRPGAENQWAVAELARVRGRGLPAKGAPDGVVIPGAMLRKGLNVLAVEIRAAPVHELAVEKTVGDKSWPGQSAVWPHALAAAARLTASSGDGLTPNYSPTPAVEIATVSPCETLSAADIVNPSESGQVLPIRMVGARNGTFSGKVVLSSADTIKGLKASLSELALTGGKGQIPASAVQVRWAERVSAENVNLSHWDPLGRVNFDRLQGNFPADIPQAKLLGDRRLLAVVPVWVTVRVPADSAAGEYQATLSIEAAGTAGPAKFSVPVRLKVNDWRIPDARDFTTHHNIFQSVDSVARHYKVPLWSEKHFELMGRSLKAFGEVGNKLCMVHLVANSPSFNNSESMVRWVRKPDPSTGSGQAAYDYDFSIAEKYMDLYEKNCGKPAILCLDPWPNCAGNAKDVGIAKGAPVSVLDPATGKVEPMAQPPYGTPENEAFWKPVLAELRKRLEKRGWWDVTAVCHINYAVGPHPTVVDVCRNIWPDGKWMQTSHPNISAFAGTAKGVSMPVPYSEWVWGCGFAYDPDGGGRPWPVYPRFWTNGNKRREFGNPRMGLSVIIGDSLRETSTLAMHRFISEATLQGNLNGLGRVGGDSWMIPSDKGGKPVVLFDTFKAVGPGESTTALFSAGPDGAVFNQRMEMFREGVQVAEAIIFLERAQEEKRVAPELNRKIVELLDERARYFLRGQESSRAGNRWLAMECSGWQERDDRLFALCAEVAGRK